MTVRSPRPCPHGPDGPDAGVGVVEVVVAMSLAVLLVSWVAPGLTTAVMTSARMAAVAAANQHVAAALDGARAELTANCAGVLGAPAPTTPVVKQDDRPDGRAGTVRVRTELTGDCDSGDPVLVTVTATTLGATGYLADGRVLATATTRVLP